MRTLLVGSFGAGNAGDELLCMSGLKDYPDATVMTAHEALTRAFSGFTGECISPPPRGFRSALAYIFHRKKALQILTFDQIIFPGGGLFAGHTKAYLLWAWTIFWLRWKFPQATFRLQAMGVDPADNPVKRMCVRYAAQVAASFTVRDEASAKALKMLNITAQIVPDAAWQVLQSLSNTPQKTHTLINSARSIPDHIQQKLPPDSLFIAFDSKDIQYCPAGIPWVFPVSMTELQQVFSGARDIIAERFHSVVCGLAWLKKDQTQLLRTPYAPKVEALKRSHNLPLFHV